MEEKKDNDFLYKHQLETLKIFYEKGLLTKEQYEFELTVLDKRIQRPTKTP